MDNILSYLDNQKQKVVELQKKSGVIASTGTRKWWPGGDRKGQIFDFLFKKNIPLLS